MHRDSKLCIVIFTIITIAHSQGIHYTIRKNYSEVGSMFSLNEVKDHYKKVVHH